MTFNAAHKLWVDEWSEEENKAMFGKCANKNWHGRCAVSVILRTTQRRPNPPDSQGT